MIKVSLRSVCLTEPRRLTSVRADKISEVLLFTILYSMEKLYTYEKRKKLEMKGTFHGAKEVIPLRKYHYSNKYTQNNIASKCMTKIRARR